MKLMKPVMAADGGGPGAPNPPPAPCLKCGKSPCKCPPKEDETGS